MNKNFTAKRQLSSLISLCLWAATLLFGHPAIAAEDDGVVKIDRVVAVVEQSVITEFELAERIRTVAAQIEKSGGQLPPENILAKQVLERLINDRVLLDYASQTGLKVDDNQLDRTIERIAEQNKLSVPEFKKALEADGISYRKFREDIRNEIIIARLREREVENKINISESEIDNYLTTQANSAQDEYDLAHILIRTPEDSSPEDLQKLKAKAEEALDKLNQGTDFAQVSASYSDAPNALEGGKLGWKAAGQIPELFAEAIKPLSPGALTPILRSANGFHILKLLDRRGNATSMLVDQTKVRHILIKLTEVVSENDAKHRMESIKERLEHGGDFQALARQYSEDGSASNGGNLGWINPGDTVPAFEQAMNKLGINEISEPVRSPFGFHIIQVLERRKQDMSKEAARLKARQEIRAKKADEAYQDWVREQRDRAYVELRLEDKF